MTFEEIKDKVLTGKYGNLQKLEKDCLEASGFGQSAKAVFKIAKLREMPHGLMAIVCMFEAMIQAANGLVNPGSMTWPVCPRCGTSVVEHATRRTVEDYGNREIHMTCPECGKSFKVNGYRTVRFEYGE